MEKKMTVIAIIIGMILVGVLTKIDIDNQNRIKEAITKKYAPEMSKCWEEVADNGGRCELKFIYIDNGEILVDGEVKKIEF